MAIRHYIIFIFYVAVSLCIGHEFHPFSTYPMYNSFPNWGYVFYLQDTKGKLLPYSKVMRDARTKNAGYVGHTFYSFMERENCRYGDGHEDTACLRRAGAALMQMIWMDEDKSRAGVDSTLLVRRFYYIQDGQMRYRDDVMYEDTI